MRLVQLSTAIVGACAVGLAALVGLAVYSYDRMQAHEAEVGHLLSLQRRISDFSVASDNLLLYGADPGLWRAYLGEAEALRGELERIGRDHPPAVKAARRVGVIVAAVESAISEAPDGESRRTGAGPLDLSARARVLMSQVAEHGIGLDTATEAALQARQHALEREATRVTAAFGGAALLFGALSVTAFGLVHRRISGPTRALAATIDRIRAGDLDARAEVRGGDELADVAASFNRLLDQQQADQAQLRQYRALVEGSADLCAIVDADYRFRLVNSAYAEVHGLARQQVEGARLADILGGDYFEHYARPAIDRCLATGQAATYERELTFPGLGRRQLLIRYHPVALDARDPELVAAAITDVTAIKQAEAELREQSRLVEAAGRLARLGGWTADLAEQRVHWSDVVAEIHGMSPGYAPTVEEGIGFYAPEWRDRFRELYTACAEHGEPFDEELQIVTVDGERRWVRAVGEAVHDDNGGIIRVGGALQDISQRRAQDARLRKLSHIVDQSPVAVAVTDFEGRIEYVNPSFEAVSGYSRDELIGRTPALIQSGRTSDATYRELWETISSGEIWYGEIEHRRKDGTPYWEYEVISPLADEQGHLTNYVAIKQDITERKRMERELSRLAYEDRLTGTLTRNGFVRTLSKDLDHRGWQPEAMVAMLDVERLRDVNESYGYASGDDVLIRIGERLRAHAGDEAILGRTGGDEFVVFLPRGPGRTPAALREALSSAFARPFAIDDTMRIEVFARFGYTLLGRQARDAESLVREAELALYHGLSEGASGDWMAYTGELDEQTQHRIGITRELRRALKEDELELHFQPKVELDSGRLVSGEALVRWRHPERGLQSPGSFIPVAEQSQLIGPLGDWVLREACQCLRAWQDDGLAIVHIAINVSVVQLTIGDFAATVREALDTHGIEASALSLEITESVFEQESEQLRSELRELHELGVRLSLDDFGTGYSSLLYLQRYPFDEIKIDQAFVQRMRADAYSRKVVDTVLDLAGALAAEAIAEGVEDAATRDALWGAGCRLGQGYFYSMPLEAEDFRWLLEQRSVLPLASGQR